MIPPTQKCKKYNTGVFITAPNRAPAETQRSGFGGKRTSDRESESCRLRRDEGFVVRSDDGEGLTEMNKLLERVGNLSEKYSSKWIDWLPDFSLLVALKWIMLVLILGTATLAGWYGAAAIRGLFL